MVALATNGCTATTVAVAALVVYMTRRFKMFSKMFVILNVVFIVVAPPREATTSSFHFITGNFIIFRVIASLLLVFLRSLLHQ